MKNKKIKKIVKIIAILICILFICSSIISTIMAVDTIHLETCHIEHCNKCILIKTAICFAKNINYIISYIVLITITIPLSYIILCKENKKTQNTLVYLKVRLDE